MNERKFLFSSHNVKGTKFILKNKIKRKFASFKKAILTYIGNYLQKSTDLMLHKPEVFN